MSECIILLWVHLAVDTELVGEKNLEASLSSVILQAQIEFRTITLFPQFNCPILVPLKNISCNLQTVDFNLVIFSGLMRMSLSDDKVS